MHLKIQIFVATVFSITIYTATNMIQFTSNENLAFKETFSVLITLNREVAIESMCTEFI